jgi:hypothetical protein
VHRHSGRAIGIGLTALLTASVGPSSAASGPTGADVAIRTAVANGFVRVAEVRLGNGAAIATFESRDARVRVLGEPGSVVSFYPDETTRATEVAPSRGGLAMEMSQPTRPKTAAAATAYHDAGRTVVGDLVALGMPRPDAEREFGDMETMDGTTRPTGAAPRPNATFARFTRPVPGGGPTTFATSSATTPYATQCVSVSTLRAGDGSDVITGYGCTTFYLVAQAGTDWWFNDKFKFSAHSSDRSLFPVRLRSVAWKVSWSSLNTVHDWDPATTTSLGGCTTVSASSETGTKIPIRVTISAQICPDSIGLWTIGQLVSGAIWKGIEHDTDYDAAIGVQSVHNPPAASPSYTSYWALTW